jgi:hypothetical protein
VNLEIEGFNRKLKKIGTSYNHVALSETNLKRECFTRHGLHWNLLGKDLVVKLITYQNNKVIEKGFQTLMNLVWKDNALVGNISTCNEGRVTSVFDMGKVNVNVTSEDRKGYERRKQQD